MARHDCFLNNHADGNGGGIYQGEISHFDNAGAVYDGNLLRGNSATEGGGLYTRPEYRENLNITYRNLGLAATTLAADLKVFQDEGSAGQKLVWSGQTPAEMLFMDSNTFTAQWQAASGVHKLMVSVYSPGPVAGLAWTISAGTAINGYIVYLGVGTDTLQYVGQTTIPSYVDQGVSAGTRYRYAVSFFTDVGVESAQRAEVAALVPAGVYLPVVFRAQ